MKTLILQVDFINGIFPLELPTEHMPVSLYIDDLKDGIVKLSEMMVTMPKEEREGMSEFLVPLSCACQLLSDIRTAVVRYSASCGKYTPQVVESKPIETIRDSSFSAVFFCLRFLHYSIFGIIFAA